MVRGQWTAATCLPLSNLAGTISRLRHPLKPPSLDRRPRLGNRSASRCIDREPVGPGSSAAGLTAWPWPQVSLPSWRWLYLCWPRLPCADLRRERRGQVSEADKAFAPQARFWRQSQAQDYPADRVVALKIWVGRAPKSLQDGKDLRSVREALAPAWRRTVWRTIRRKTGQEDLVHSGRRWSAGPVPDDRQAMPTRHRPAPIEHRSRHSDPLPVHGQAPDDHRPADRACGLQGSERHDACSRTCPK